MVSSLGISALTRTSDERKGKAARFDSETCNMIRTAPCGAETDHD